MELKRFKELFREIEEEEGITDETEVYIGCYECLRFIVDVQGNEIVLDIDGDKIIKPHS